MECIDEFYATAIRFSGELAVLGKQYPISAAVLATVSAVGLFKLVTLSLSLWTLILQLFVLPPVSLAKYGAKSKRAWAIVTGATAGLGEQFAHQLAAKGFNVAIVSRSTEKLEALQKTLEDKYKVSVKFLAFDAAADRPEDYAALAKFVAELETVTVLVNNVGVSHSMPVPFLETPVAEIKNIIDINVTATVKITQVVLPYIKASVGKVSQRGLVLTMSSFAGLIPTPLLATYAGSKAFLASWSNSLAGELHDAKIDSEVVLSYLVTSAMSKVKYTSLMIPNPRAFVRSTLGSVGRRGGAQERFATMTPYWSHALLHWVVENTFGVWSKTINFYNLRGHEDIRRRALRKQARLAKAQ